MANLHTRIYACLRDGDSIAALGLLGEAHEALTAAEDRLTRIEAAARLCGQHNYTSSVCPVTAAVEEGT